MALENYREMRDEVRDAEFELRAELAFELERRFPGRFIPRYSMVMFHPEISYAEAQRRGTLQAQILAELTDRAHGIGEVDFQARDDFSSTRPVRQRPGRFRGSNFCTAPVQDPSREGDLLATPTTRRARARWPRTAPRERARRLRESP